MDLISHNISSGIFIQVGAGAGDKDAGALYRDGFTEFIKSLPREKINKIILIEPNPTNLPMLKECWKDYPEATIIQGAITTKELSHKTLDFYYCPDDKPHYQVASLNIEHVRKHYKDNVIEKISVPTIDLVSLFGSTEIDLLSLDIEGIDAEVILDTDFSQLNVKFLSFEYIHIEQYMDIINQHLNSHNLYHRGLGVDHNGFDLLYAKV